MWANGGQQLVAVIVAKKEERPFFQVELGRKLGETRLETKVHIYRSLVEDSSQAITYARRGFVPGSITKPGYSLKSQICRLDESHHFLQHSLNPILDTCRRKSCPT
jgi:hypothetical protein